MKIATVEAIPLEIPFTHGGKPFGWGGQAWTRLSILLVRVETESGLVGYGEAFSYSCRRARGSGRRRADHGGYELPLDAGAGPVHSAGGGRRLIRLPAVDDAPRESFARKRI